MVAAAVELRGGQTNDTPYQTAPNHIFQLPGTMQLTPCTLCMPWLATPFAIDTLATYCLPAVINAIHRGAAGSRCPVGAPCNKQATLSNGHRRQRQHRQPTARCAIIKQWNWSIYASKLHYSFGSNVETSYTSTNTKWASALHMYDERTRTYVMCHIMCRVRNA